MEDQTQTSLADGAGRQEDTPETQENQAEQSVKAEPVATPPTPKGSVSRDSVAQLRVHLLEHIHKINEHLLERESLAQSAIGTNIRKPYIRRWVAESNRFFVLGVHLKTRLRELDQRTKKS